MQLVIVTGMSGAGKSVALKTLEDQGFEATDNIPLLLLPLLLGLGRDDERKLALGVDVRAKDFSAERFHDTLEALKAEPDIDTTLLFLDCDDETLRRRFTETRRRHPLALDRTVTDGIKLERQLLQPAMEAADLVLDTTDTGVSELRQRLVQQFSSGAPQLTLSVMSFSYRRGVPREADLLFDVRFLRNPFYEVTLKSGTGQDAAVQAYIAEDEAFEGFYQSLTGLITPLLPRYLQEGKSYLTVGIGCTGGRHRSVFVAEKLAGFFAGLGYKVSVRHRDLGA